MLDIPQEVKNLFHQDGVYKNIRITFDDPELPEITNAQIVAGSFSFRESVSSADSVTFGACEASSLEFETVGVQNILGKWFSAYIEVDASTLPAELQQIRADLYAPVYPVPLGSFIVTSCPRNKGAMAHRRVSSVSFIDAGYRPISGEIVNACRFVFSGLTKKESTVMQTSLARIWTYYGIIPGDKYAVKEQGSISQNETALMDTIRAMVDGCQIQGIRNTNTPFNVTVSVRGKSVKDEIISCEANYKDLDTVANYIAGTATSFAFTASPTGVFYTNRDGVRVDVTRDELRKIIRDTVINYFGGTKCGAYLGLTGTFTGSKKRDTAQLIMPKLGKKTIAPFTFTNRSGSSFVAETPLIMPSGVWIFYGGTSNNYSLIESNAKYTTYTLQNMPAVVNDVLTVQAVPTYTDGGQIAISFEPCLEGLKKIFAGALELAGVFASGVRSGDNAAAYFDDTPVVRLQRGDYSECWYDDYNFEPVGTIAYKLNGQDRVYTFGPGQSVYTFANNDIFSYFKNCTEAKAQALFDALLIPALAKLKYTPVDLDARGLPYLQAGDCIEIETEDGEIVKTYILTRELSGEQHMVDRIEAPGVNVLEVIT